MSDRKVSYTNLFSFFGTQEGDFSLTVLSISAAMSPASHPLGLRGRYRDDPDELDVHWDDARDNEKQSQPSLSTDSKTCQGWLSWLFGACSAPK